jgi:hypothetical protein
MLAPFESQVYEKFMISIFLFLLEAGLTRQQIRSILRLSVRLESAVLNHQYVEPMVRF